MFTQALLVGLVLFGVWFVEKCLTTPMVFRPLVVGTLVGIALGDPVMGAKCGAALEVVFMGAIQIGAAVPPDAMLGAGIGTALAIITGKGPEVAFTLGFPIAVFGQSIKIVCFIVRSWYMGLACKYAREVQVGKMHALNWFGLILQCTIYGLVGFCTIYFGSSVVENVLNNIPEVVMKSLEVAGGLLPAVGFALLLQPMIAMVKLTSMMATLLNRNEDIIRLFVKNYSKFVLHHQEEDLKLLVSERTVGCKMLTIALVRHSLRTILIVLYS